MIKFSGIKDIYNEYLDTLYSYSLHLGFDEQTTMDAIHDVFYKLCTNHSSLKEIKNKKSYLLRSLRNRLIDIKRGSRDIATDDITEEHIIEKLPFDLYVTVEDELIMQEDAEEIKQKVEKVLNQLTNRQREAVYLRYIQEYDYEKTANIMQISIPACRNLISKSLYRMKDSTIPISLLLLFIK